jgi:hypothetical protein
MGGRAVLRRVSANPSLRRVEAAFLGFSCAEFGVWLAVLVYAYQRGGTSLAAAIAVIQLLPAAAVAPIASVLTDRKGGAFGLWVGYIGQALSIGATAALLLWQAPSIAIYAAAVAAASAVTLTRPAHAALLPALVDDPRELTAANVVTGWLESVSFFVGPGLAGVLIAVDGPGLACALFAGGVTLSALLVAPLRSRGPAGASAVTEDKLEEAAAVMGVLRSEPGVAILLTLVAAQYVAIGALDVLVVVLAIKVLALGSSGAGYLDAAFGAGGVLGGIAALGLIGRSRLVPPLLLAAYAWGAAFLLLGAGPPSSARSPYWRPRAPVAPCSTWRGAPCCSESSRMGCVAACSACSRAPRCSPWPSAPLRSRCLPPSAAPAPRWPELAGCWYWAPRRPGTCSCAWSRPRPPSALSCRCCEAPRSSASSAPRSSRA